MGAQISGFVDSQQSINRRTQRCPIKGGMPKQMGQGNE
jgi:hypothetical protein